MMNRDHVIGGGSVLTATQMLSEVLAYYQGSAAPATAEAGLIVLAIGAVWGVAQMWLSRRATSQSLPATP